MRRKTEAAILAVLFWVIMVGANSSMPAASDTITIVGEVNDANQVVADGVIYEVDDTPEGNELVTNYISRVVEVTGNLRIEGDMRILAVKLFKLIKE